VFAHTLIWIFSFV